MFSQTLWFRQQAGNSRAPYRINIRYGALGLFMFSALIVTETAIKIAYPDNSYLTYQRKD